MFKLLEMVDGNVIREHMLECGEFRIGRGPGNDLQPDDASVSGAHALVTVAPSAYLEGAQEVSIEDLGSTNGTQVNGRSIMKHRLKHDDILLLGALRLKLVDEQMLAMDGTRILLREEEV